MLGRLSGIEYRRGKRDGSSGIRRKKRLGSSRIRLETSGWVQGKRMPGRVVGSEGLPASLIMHQLWAFIPGRYADVFQIANNWLSQMLTGLQGRRDLALLTSVGGIHREQVFSKEIELIWNLCVC